ncbi:MAG: hypothetical protein IMZ53_11400 [Thermoplasmata archaeon]|nr:hypothetical protein [Thermoplasmata archaeon]
MIKLNDSYTYIWSSDGEVVENKEICKDVQELVSGLIKENYGCMINICVKSFGYNPQDDTLYTSDAVVSWEVKTKND